MFIFTITAKCIYHTGATVKPDLIVLRIFIPITRISINVLKLMDLQLSSNNTPTQILPYQLHRRYHTLVPYINNFLPAISY